MSRKTRKDKREKKIPKIQLKEIPKTQPKQLEKVIKRIIAEIAEIDERKIKPETRFVEDLNMDSMMALEILAAIEKTYKIEIPEESLSKMTNLKEVLELTKELLPKNGHKKRNKK